MLDVVVQFELAFLASPHLDKLISIVLIRRLDAHLRGVELGRRELVDRCLPPRLIAL